MGTIATSEELRLERWIGSYRGDEPGRLVVCVGGVHGNEPAGVMALHRVLEALRRRRPRFRGEFIALAGNLAALARGVRYIDLDLNRIWIEDRIRRLRTERGEGREESEDEQQIALLEAMEQAFERTRGPAVFVDLHTSSADGQPFVCIGDTLRNRRFARRFPVPVILGLEEQVDGSLLEYVNSLGHVTIGAEGGRHDLPGSVENHEAYVWLALGAAGNLDGEAAPWLEERRRRLARQARDLPSVLEVRYRHPVEPEDDFTMEPGYRNFQPVSEGEVLARDRDGPVRAPEDGRILLPLYQGLGSDGFFLMRKFDPLWLRISEVLRRMRAHVVLPWLPGVRRDPDRPDTLLADPRVARWFTVEIFHLLGYRKRRPRGDLLVFSRRK